MKKSNSLFICMIIMTIVTVVILCLSCIQMFTQSDFKMANWLMVVALGLFAVDMIIGLIIEKFHVRKIGFYLLHAGLVLILIGSFMFFVKGQSYQVSYPVSKDGYYAVTTNKDGEVLDLQMDIKVLDAKTEYYPPAYSVYEIDTETGKMNLTESDLEFVNGYLDLGPYGGTRLSEAELFASLSTDPYTNATYYYITQNTVLMQTITPKHYEVKFVLVSVEEETYFGREANPLVLTVNHPVRKGGWKIYLLAVSGSGEQAQVTFLFKKDPGEFLMYLGIGLLVVGSFISCFMKPIKTESQQKKKIAKGGKK